MNTTNCTDIHSLVELLNFIYNEVLGRDVDESGIKSYLPRLQKNPQQAQHFIRQDLYNSLEYRSKNKSNDSFNSLTGDRISYINSKDVSLIDKSRFANIMNDLIRMVVLLENPDYPLEKLNNRIDTVKKSLIHIGTKNHPFTIFPHLEYSFNTEKFNEFLKTWSGFQYYVLYICIANIWKILFNKTVDTCGTKEFGKEMLSIKNIKDFDDLFNVIGNYIIDYLSIRITGKILKEEERVVIVKFIKAKNSKNTILYLQDLCSISLKNEMEAANKYLESLKKKPKVLVMIAYLETQNQYFIERMMYHVNKLKEENPLIDFDFALDNERVDKEDGDYTPWSRVKRIRNLMINKYPIRNYDYLYIIDSDIIDYPHNFPTRAIGLNPTGITAPVALIQNSIVFYDWCGYQKKGNTSLYGKYGKYIKNLSVKERNFNLRPPYVDDESRLTEIDCVGCTYIVPTSVFDQTYGDMQKELLETFNIAKVNNHKIADNIVQYEDHPCFTDHFTICAAVRANGGKIYMDRGSAAYHADLPIHGEGWH